MRRLRSAKHSGRFVDSALEEAGAQRSGLGWIGKNGNLMCRSGWFFFFIATLITDLDLEYMMTVLPKTFCGSCTKCIDHLSNRCDPPSKSYWTEANVFLFHHRINPDAFYDTNRHAGYPGLDVWLRYLPRMFAHGNRFAKPNSEEFQFTTLAEILNFFNCRLGSVNWRRFHIHF